MLHRNDVRRTRRDGFRVASAAVVCGLGLLLQACSGGSSAQSADRTAASRADSTLAGSAVTAQTPLPPGSSVDAGPKVLEAPIRMLFIGTSLTAGYGLDDPTDAWPSVVGEIADSLGYRVTVQNAGLSGETSAGALRRADWVLRDTSDVVVIETGANDGLRGTSVADMEKNLGALVTKVRERQPGAQVVIVQMEAPPNLGASYTREFRGAYGRVAKASGAMLTPFLLDGVAGVPTLNQADGIHPTEAGAAKAARAVWPALRTVLDGVRARATAL
jgi:acyl-CoA thioesterase I